MKPVHKILLWIFGIIAAFFLILTFAAGPVVKGIINRSGEEMLGRKMHVEDASVNPFTGHITVDSLFIAEADGSTRFVSFHRFDADLSVLRALCGTYIFDDVTIDQLRVDVQQRDTVFNFSDILELLGEDEEEEPSPVVLNNINIRQSYIRYQDLLVNSDFRINDFSLFIPGIDLRDINTSVGVSLALGDGGTLVTNVDYDARHQVYKVNLQLSDFALSSILPYVRQTIAFERMDGVLSVDLTMQGSLQHMLNFSMRGNAGIRDLNILDPDGTPMIQCDTVAIGVRDIDLAQNRIELSRVLFDRPYIAISYGRDSLDNFTRLMTEKALDTPVSDEPSEPSVSYNGKEKELRLIIDRLAIQDASVSYRDESLVAEPFVYDLTHVNLNAPLFTLNRTNHITISAQLGAQGSLKMQYDGKLSDQHDMHLSLTADGIAFRDFSPYIVHMFGNEVSGGTLSVNMLADAVSGELFAQNRFVLDNPIVEKKRSNVNAEMNIPFRTGMYLLTDRNNILDIDLPVRGNIDEPRFSYKRLIFRTLGKMVVKVATSPFRRSRSSVGTPFSGDDLLQLDNRSLDDISLDSISAADLKDE